MKLLSLRAILLASLFSFTLGCSSTDNSAISASENNIATQSKAEELGLKCQNTKSTGTHVKKRSCTTLAQRKRDKADGERFIRNEIKYGRR
jgi:hypothetical protein